jgi:hypothetical protein
MWGRANKRKKSIDVVDGGVRRGQRSDAMLRESRMLKNENTPWKHSNLRHC